MQKQKIVNGYCEFLGATYSSDEMERDLERGIEKDMSQYLKWVRVTFRLSEVDLWFETSDGFTSVTFSNGTDFKINCTYNNFSEMMTSYEEQEFNYHLN